MYKLTRNLIESTNNIRAFGLAWNHIGMDDGENEPLIFLKTKESITLDYVINLPLIKNQTNVWGEPEIVYFYKQSELLGITIGNDVTFEQKVSKRDHHLPLNKSIFKTFPLLPIYIDAIAIGETFKNLNRLMIGSITHKGAVLPLVDRLGHSEDLKIRKPYEVISIIESLFGNNKEGLDIVTCGTVPVADTDSPLYIKDGSVYHCYVENIGTLHNQFEFGSIKNEEEDEE